MSTNQKWKSQWKLIPDSEEKDEAEKRGKSTEHNDLPSAFPRVRISGQPVDFAFVNISSPTEAKDPTNRRFVRQQARRRIQITGRTPGGELHHKNSGPSDRAFIDKSDPSKAAQSGTKVLVRGKVHRAYRRRNRGISQSRAGLGNNDGSGGNFYCSGDGNPTDVFFATEYDYLISREEPIDERNPFMSDLVEETRISLHSRIGQEKLIYPIEMDQEAYQLVQYIETDSESNSVIPAFKPVWFEMIMRDPASFLQTLSTATTHRASIRGEDGSKALIYQQRAIGSLNKRLSHALLGISDGVVGTVITFLTHNVILLDVERYRVDKAGLVRIIQLRGGIETLEDNAVVRLMILWADVCGSCAFGFPPTYPLPTRYLPPVPVLGICIPQRLMNAKRNWELLYPERQELMDIFHDLYRLNHIIKRGLPDVWEDPWFLGLRINPILLRLMSIYDTERSVSIMKTESSVENILRLAALVYLGDVRIKFMVYHVTGYHFIENIKIALRSDFVEWNGFLDLRLWALVVAAVKASSADRSFFIGEIRRTMEALLIIRWTETMEIITSFLWIEEIYGVRARELGEQVTRL